jgi:hypothetical protein
VQTPSAPFGALTRGMLDSAVPDRDSLGCLKGYACAEKDNRKKEKLAIFASEKGGMRRLRKLWVPAVGGSRTNQGVDST